MEQKRKGREGRGQRQAEREREGGGDLITELFKIVCFDKAIMVRFCVLVGSVLLNGHKGRCV